MQNIHLVEKEDDSNPLKNSVVDDRVEDCPEIELCNNYRDEDDGDEEEDVDDRVEDRPEVKSCVNCQLLETLW